MKQIICLVLIALAASKTIPELYKQNNGYFTSDYSVTYNNPVKSGDFGSSTEAGDINNDGIPDFLIGNPANDNNKGIAYVIYGKKGSLRQFNSMDDFQPSDGFIIKGNLNGQKLGFCASAIGDVNGDGIDDLIIGSPFWNRDSYVTEVGMAYVLFGRKSSAEFPSIVDVDRLSPTQGFRIFGEGSMNHAGYSVHGALDVNADGISDILIGAFSAGQGGKAYVIFGSKQGFTDMTLPPAPGKGFTVEGSNREDLGSSVSRVGDFNGDGVDDFIIGAHVADNWAGRAYIIYGRREGFPSTIRATDGMTLKGIINGDNFGCIVGGAGDFNGDGLQDVIIGAYSANGGRGGVYVIFGSRQNPSVLSMSATDTASSRGFNVMSSAFSQLGMGVNGGRDLNGDGLSDIIIGAPAWNKENGAVYVIYGYRPSPTFTNIWLDIALEPHQGFAMFGTQEGSRFGHFVRLLKDINQDGVNDFIVGAFTANGGKGAANLFYLPWSCPAQCLQCSKPNTCDAWVCPNKCKKCSGPNICDAWVCPDGCAKCSSPYSCDAWICPDKCKKCSGPNICDAWVCPDKCAKCSSPYTCDAWSCPANCDQCSNSDSCDSCAQGFGFIGNDCAACPANTHFLNNGYCIEVQDPFKVIKDFFGGFF